MLSSSCRRTGPLLKALYSSSKSACVVVRTFTTATSTNTSTCTAASTLANKKKQHQLFLLNRCTMAATPTFSRPKQPATAATAIGKTSTVQPQAANIQQPGSRHFHSYSSSSLSSPSWRRTFTTSSTAEQQSQQQQAKKKRTFLEWYEGHLQARPVVTKMFTGSLLWGIGDAVAQIVPQVANSEKEQSSSPAAAAAAAAAAVPDSAASSSSSSKSKSSLTYDWPRTGRAALFGFALHAPTSHVHFNFLEWLTHRVGVTGNIRIPIFKAFMEQFVYWSWISNSMYHGAMGAMQGMTLQQIYDRIADVLWETQKAQWVFWIPVQLLNFRFIPVRHQLNVVLVTSIVWTALLSAWYPPQDDNKKEDEEKKTLENKDDATITTADAAKA